MPAPGHLARGARRQCEHRPGPVYREIDLAPLTRLAEGPSPPPVTPFKATFSSPPGPRSPPARPCRVAPESSRSFFGPPGRSSAVERGSALRHGRPAATSPGRSPQTAVTRRGAGTSTSWLPRCVYWRLHMLAMVLGLSLDKRLYL